MNKTSLILLILSIGFMLPSCKYGRYVYYNTADITDHKIFPAREIQAAPEVFTFPYAAKGLNVDSITTSRKGKSKKRSFEDYLTDNHTVAFLVIKNDSIYYEKYFDNYDTSSFVNSFSVSKSITSMLIGCALEDGFIQSTQQKVTDFLPELKQNGFDKVTIEHLLDMQSGVEYRETYGPMGTVANYYYGRNLWKEVKKLELSETPGTNTHYKSCDTQILGMILEKALKGKSVTRYLEEKIWLPLGMEYPATWSLDRRDGMEKTFCCVNACARDFAKLGRLYLHQGNWNGKQIVPEQWVITSTQADTGTYASASYNNQWWLNKDGSYQAIGILGQYIYVSPKHNMIIVRMGKKSGKTGNWKALFKLIEKELE